MQPLREHLAMDGDITVYYELGGAGTAPGTERVESRDATEHPTTYRTAPRRPIQSVSSAEVETLSSKMGCWNSQLEGRRLS